MKRSLAETWKVAESLGSKFELNYGKSIPAFGLGVFRASVGDDRGTETAVGFALKEGYRLFDTAAMEVYGNEAEVGCAIKQSNIEREDIYVVTKTAGKLKGYDQCLKAFDASNKKLGLDYVDLYLIHTPRGGKILETYDAMLKLKGKGVAKSIGVSNFNISMLEGLRKSGRPTPSVNQIELHPYIRRQELVSYCHDHGIRLMEFAPLTKGRRLGEPEVVSIAEKNEVEVGRAIKQSNIKREDIYVVTKTTGKGYDECLKAFDASNKKLGLDYVDLYLMHTPRGGKILETYDAMLKLKEKGVAKSIGVSNFNISMLEGLRKSGRPTPSVNQIELHPYMRRQALVSYCRDHGILLMAFAPLTKGRRLREPEVVSIAEKYKKSVAQLFIRWSVQSGFLVIPKSSKKERISENCHVFDWSISDEDMKQLGSLPESTCYGPESHMHNIHDVEWQE